MLAPSIALNIYRIECPKAKYHVRPQSEASLQDEFENHLAMYHYQTLALLALNASEESPDSEEWGLGAYLVSHYLQQRSQELIEQFREVDER